MSDSIHIEQLELSVRVGVGEEERAKFQRVNISITLWPDNMLRDLDDDLARTVNYSAVCKKVKQFVEGRRDKLIETLADAIAAHLLRAFPIERVEIELRKFVLPDVQFVSVRLTRTRHAR
jgi:FolB domain-containing protein